MCIGFGCGVRLTFLIVIFPTIIIGFIFLIKKYKSNYLNLVKRLSLHIPIVFIITIFLVILCWPHFIVELQKGNFIEFTSLIINNTINWIDGPKIGLINGEFYEVFNTPKTYFLDVIIFRLPFYFTFLLICSYFLIFLKKINTNNEIENFGK